MRYVLRTTSLYTYICGKAINLLLTRSLQHCLAHRPLTDLKSASLACRSFNNVTESYLFKSMQLRLACLDPRHYPAMHEAHQDRSIYDGVRHISILWVPNPDCMRRLLASEGCPRVRNENIQRVVWSQTCVLESLNDIILRLSKLWSLR